MIDNENGNQMVNIFVESRGEKHNGGARTNLGFSHTATGKIMK